MPKFIVFVRATPESEKGTPPDTAMLSEMGAYNDTLRAAGMLIAADGLLASAQGARLTYTSSGKSDDVTLTKGPFPWESLVSGFWILEAADLDECVTWAKKAPFRENNQVVEVRKIAKLEDFGGDVLGKTRNLGED
ncbi:hypothetical protein BR93DRAFT_932673 [Coniochaeta sp. PMI_546]|nr:hypothetical protein BR93DRAFT_932673 [Coniochaeta sp. PMI_546]